MSLGYHYYETLQTSLSLQWIDKARAPETLGRLISVGAFASIVVYGLVWLTSDLLAMDYLWIYLIGGGVTAAIALLAWLGFPPFRKPVEQHKHLVLQKPNWPSSHLVFQSGRRGPILIS